MFDWMKKRSGHAQAQLREAYRRRLLEDLRTAAQRQGTHAMEL